MNSTFVNTGPGESKLRLQEFTGAVRCGVVWCGRARHGIENQVDRIRRTGSEYTDEMYVIYSSSKNCL